MTDTHPGPDELVALALADVEPAEQERLVAHLAFCPDCRDEYAELSDGLQQALAATPAIAPSAGFSGRVLAAMGAAESPEGRAKAPATDGRTQPPAANGRTRPRWWLLVAAAAVVGVLAGAGGTLAVVGRSPETPPGATAHQPVAADLLTSSGEVVGSAGITTLDGRAYLLLNVTSGRAGASYECILVGRDGARTSGGRWSLADEYGSGTASGSWLVPIAGDPPARVELVAPSGTVWSRASL